MTQYFIKLKYDITIININSILIVTNTDNIEKLRRNTYVFLSIKISWQKKSFIILHYTKTFLLKIVANKARIFDLIKIATDIWVLFPKNKGKIVSVQFILFTIYCAKFIDISNTTHILRLFHRNKELKREEMLSKLYFNDEFWSISYEK